MCGYTFDTPLLQMEIFTGGNIVRKCPKCNNKIETNINKGNKND